MQEPEVAAEQRVGGDGVARARLEYVERARQQQAELERRAQGRRAARLRVGRGREDGGVEGVVLSRIEAGSLAQAESRNAN